MKTIAKAAMAMVTLIATYPGAMAQPKAGIGLHYPLTVGDTIPDLTINYVVNHSIRKTSLSALTDKLLIIDFWATWCGSCLEGIAKLQDIKASVGPGLNVLMVTDENDSTVKAFERKRKKYTKDSTAFNGIYNDTLFRKLFPFGTIPHYVWIGRGGVIKAITGYTEMNLENIVDMMEGRHPKLALKDDDAREHLMDLLEPLFLKGNGGNGENLIWYSVFSKYIEGLRGSIINIKNSQGFVVCCNTDAYTCFRIAYSDDSDFSAIRLPGARIVFNVKDSSKYFSALNIKQNTAALFNYNLITPEMPIRTIKKYMQEDLKKYFGLTAHWEKRKTTCVILTADDTMLIAPIPYDKLDLKNPAFSEYTYTSLNNEMKQFRNNLGESFFFRQGYPVIDETGYSGQCYFKLEADFNNLESFNLALSKYKMHLKLEEREVSVLIVTEAG